MPFSRIMCRLAIVLIAVVVLSLGCGQEKKPAEGEAQVTESDDGATVQLSKGQVLVVTLSSNPSTGYNWNIVQPAEPVLKQRGGAQFETSESDGPPVPGAGGSVIFRFEAVETGGATLRMAYHRGGGEEPAETFTLQVMVQ